MKIYLLMSFCDFYFCVSVFLRRFLDIWGIFFPVLICSGSVQSLFVLCLNQSAINTSLNVNWSACLFVNV